MNRPQNDTLFDEAKEMVGVLHNALVMSFGNPCASQACNHVACEALVASAKLLDRLYQEDKASLLPAAERDLEIAYEGEEEEDEDDG